MANKSAAGHRVAVIGGDGIGPEVLTEMHNRTQYAHQSTLQRDSTETRSAQTKVGRLALGATGCSAL
ncbi:MAG: hypothetical protein ACKPAJ_01745, partial [Actinomycetota bacterium]